MLDRTIQELEGMKAGTEAAAEIEDGTARERDELIGGHKLRQVFCRRSIAVEKIHFSIKNRI